MAKFSENVLAIINAVGLQLTEEQIASINKIELEADDDQQAVFDSIKTGLSESLVKLERKGRSEAYDSVDAELLGLEDILGDALKQKVSSIKGPKKIAEIKALIQAKIDETQKAAAKGGSVDTAALQKQLTELQALVSTKDQELINKLAEKDASFQTERLNDKLLTRLAGRKDLVEAYANEKALSKMVLPDLLDYVRAKGAVITPEQLDVLKADTQTPYGHKAGKQIGIDDFIAEFAEANGYLRKADPQPTKATVVPQQGQKVANSTNALAERMRASMTD